MTSTPDKKYAGEANPRPRRQRGIKREGDPHGMGERTPQPRTPESTRSMPHTRQQPMHRNTQSRRTLLRNHTPRSSTHHPMEARRNHHHQHGPHTLPLAPQPRNTTRSSKSSNSSQAEHSNTNTPPRNTPRTPITPATTPLPPCFAAGRCCRKSSVRPQGSRAIPVE